MTTVSKVRAAIACLFFCLILAPGPDGHAQTLPIQEWDQWNAASRPLYPSESWHQYATPEEAGWSSKGLAKARETSDQAGSAAVMVIYDGAVLAQWGQVERRFKCHSVRKSLLSALYGVAVAKGDIDANETLGSIGIDDDAGLTATEKSARVSDLLKSRSGVYLPAAYESHEAEEDRPERGSHEPGAHWYYNNWDFNVLATIYNKKTTGDVFEAFHSSISEPLQMEDFELRHTYYHYEPGKSRHPAYRFRMSARDLGRFGLLFLNEGKWENEQVIPSQWVRESTEAHSTYSEGGYGYMWWMVSGPLGELGTYAAFGHGGQGVYIVPGAKLVFVHRVDTYADKTVDYKLIRKILIQALQARVGPPRAKPALVPLPASPAVDPGPVLDKAQLASLTGRYQEGAWAVTVNAIDGHLELEAPNWGRFTLIPRSPTEFLVEDEQLPLAFQTDESGRASALRIWFNSDEPYKMIRAR